MIKLRDLQYLVAVDQHRHFGKAAEACFVSQPTLSGQLIKLEQQLGVQLFERHRKTVILTRAGATLVGKARATLRCAEDFEQSAKVLLDPLQGDVHVGLIPTLAPYLLPHVMAPLQQSFPALKVYLYEQQTQVLLDRLNRGELDLLILPWLEDMEKFERYSLFDEPLLLMAPADHPLLNGDKLVLDDLSGYELLTLEDGHCLRDQAMGYCFAAGARENNTFRATSLETLRYMVASGAGITLMPELAVKGQPEQFARIRRFSAPEPGRNISLVVRNDFARKALASQMAAVVRNAAKSVLIRPG